MSNTDADVRIFALSQIIKEHTDAPYVAHAYNSRGYEYDDRKDYKQAIADYTKAIELNPNYAEAYNNRANAYCDEGDYRKALEDYNKALYINHDYSVAYCNRANVFINLEMYDEAQRDHEKAISFNPISDNAYGKYAIMLCNQEIYDCALEKINYAIKLNNQEWKWFYIRSKIFKEKKQYKNALDDAKESLEIAQRYGKDKDIISLLQNNVKDIKSCLPMT